MNKDEQRMIYGYDTFYHEKYCCSVDYFIDNYKGFAEDSLTFRLFHSKEERDDYARSLLPFTEDDAWHHQNRQLDQEINLDKAVSS